MDPRFHSRASTLDGRDSLFVCFVVGSGKVGQNKRKEKKEKGGYEEDVKGKEHGLVLQRQAVSLTARQRCSLSQRQWWIYSRTE